MVPLTNSHTLPPTHKEIGAPAPSRPRTVRESRVSRRSSECDCDLKNFTEVDFDNHVGLIMTIVENNEERLIGVGRFVREASEDEAESAFVVDDEYQGRGAASSLLQHLVKLARPLGITIFKAYVQADNLNMLGVFERSGLPMTKTAEGDITQIVLRFAPE